MPKVFALLVGIDSYRSPGLDLQGCVNDVELAARLLRDRIEPADLAIETLCDEQATRVGIIDRFRGHLGAADAGDIALFWFSGHGSTGPLPEELWYAESAGRCQTTVCHDSRAGVPDLYDKELAVLVSEVLANGARMVTVNDSCHSHSAMRGDSVPGLRPRLAPSASTPPALQDLLAELVRAVADPSRPQPGMQQRGHVALSACDEWQVANETVLGGVVHGAFSAALGRALVRLDPDASYRQVLVDARCRVEGRYRQQRPTLEALGDLADRAFLGGALRPRASNVVMRRIRRDWELDVGALHGVVAGSRFAVHRSEPLREVRVTDVRTERCGVDPIGWTPDNTAQYEMVLTDAPLPSVAVSIQASPDVAARLTAAIGTAGAGGPSPHVRVVPAADEATARLLLRVRETDGGGAVQVTSTDHEPLAPWIATDGPGIVSTVRDLEHIARWMQVRNLANPASALEGAVVVEVLPAPPGGARPPRDHGPSTGSLEFTYAATGIGWQPPAAYIRLHNTTGRRLFCVLLDLTDRYRMHADLFPGEWLEPGCRADAGRGYPITLSLPPDRPVEPGASTTDWLVLLVAEAPFSSDPFSLPRLRELPRSVTRGGRRGITGVLDRLGLRAITREAALAPDTADDWAVSVTEVTTRVPGKNS